MSFKRRKVFEKIIRGDPQQAISMAYPQKIIEITQILSRST